MKSKLQKIVIPLIIFHLFGDVVNKAGSFRICDKVTTPTADAPYVTPSVERKSAVEKKAIKNQMESNSTANQED